MPHHANRSQCKQQRKDEGKISPLGHFKTATYFLPVFKRTPRDCYGKTCNCKIQEKYSTSEKNNKMYDKHTNWKQKTYSFIQKKKANPKSFNYQRKYC